MDNKFMSSHNNISFGCRTLPTGVPQAEILVKVLHRNFMGADDFLGQTCLDLKDFDVYEKPKTR